MNESFMTDGYVKLINLLLISNVSATDDDELK